MRQQRNIRPSPSSLGKLFLTGATVGPIVDSFHNQSLLTYQVAPIFLRNDEHVYLASSWTVVPLLGVAYVVLGSLLPSLIESMMISAPFSKIKFDSEIRTATMNQHHLRYKAILAVLSTALIIKLSNWLELHDMAEVFNGAFDSVTHNNEPKVMLLALAALAQWWSLDRSLVALLAATIVSIGGPLSELPFVGHGVWTYLPSAADYFPLHDLGIFLTQDDLINRILTPLFGTKDYMNLGLASLTGPCYFAVTMDAIALGRWFAGTQATLSEDES